MPRTNMGKVEPPPIDWLMAAVLERKTVLGYDLRNMADIAGVTYDTMRKYIRVSPLEWQKDAMDRVLKAFGINAKVTVEEVQKESDL